MRHRCAILSLVMRGRLAVTSAVFAALVGEWVGHSLNYFRLAGLAGLKLG
jgi:hypothetical protein